LSWFIIPYGYKENIYIECYLFYFIAICENCGIGGYCASEGSEIKCVCQPGWTGDNCDEGKTKRKITSKEVEK